MKKYFLIFISSFFLIGCSTPSKFEMNGYQYDTKIEWVNTGETYYKTQPKIYPPGSGLNKEGN